MAAVATDLTTSPEVEPAKKPRPATALENSEGDWLCTGCLNRVANEKDRFKYDGKAEFTFSNPEGIRFGIITFSQTMGCRETGVPTLDHTWFPEHAWSFCQCDRCQMHLGWFYSGPHDFVGLIRNRLVRGRCVWN
jgi:hypothetical protein